MLQIYDFLSHFVSCSVFIFDVASELLVVFSRSLYLFHFLRHFLDQFRQLLILFCLLLELFGHLTVLLRHLLNKSISLVEFFLDELEFAGVRKGVLWGNDVLELLAQTVTFFYIDFNFDFDLGEPSVANIPFQGLNLFDSWLVLCFEISNLAFQVYHQVSIIFDTLHNTIGLSCAFNLVYSMHLSKHGLFLNK